ncbi:MAG: DMT family transporter [Myxococcota bacterium]
MKRGALYMILASLMFTVMLGTVKVARQELSALEVMVWRATVSIPLALAFAWKPGLAIVNRGGMVLRGLFGFGAMACFFTAARGLDIADLSIIAKLQPILIALLAPIALGRHERASGTLWLLLLAGLSGCALIVGPDLRVGSLYGLWAVAATLLATGAHLAIRHLGRSDDARTIVFWFQVAVLVLALSLHVLLTGGGMSLPSAALWPYLAGCGIAATIGQVLLTHAYALDRAAVVAAASYTGPAFAVLADLFVFGVLPGPAVVTGGLLVVGAGLVLVLSGRRQPELAARREDDGAAIPEAHV